MQKQAEAGTNTEELAYLLLEEARLRCKTMLPDEHDVEDDPDSLTLNGLYGDLGVAGYYASARLEPGRRRQLLAQAHARAEFGSEPGSDPSGSVRQLVDVTYAATRSVERALAITGLLDHMHLAHIHVMSASETLDAMFAVQS